MYCVIDLSFDSYVVSFDIMWFCTTRLDAIVMFVFSFYSKNPLYYTVICGFSKLLRAFFGTFSNHDVLY